jgi:nickel-dependent lactate racemase
LGLPFGKNFIEINLSNLEDNYIHVLYPDPLTLKKISLADQEDIVEKSLRKPIGDKSLSDWYNNGEKLAIIVPDITRNCSVNIYLPKLIKYLEHTCNVNKKFLKIIIATGNHRKCTESEIKELVGEYVFNNYKIENHDPSQNLKYLGITSHGNKIFVNNKVVDSDKVIVTGNITFHNFAGFSGGRKSILPGISGKETILYNHRLMVENNTMNKFCDLGILEKNPINADMWEAVDLLDPNESKIYSLNVVTNMYGQIIKSFSGSIKEVFNAGVKYTENKYKVLIDKKADVVIASSGGYPYDINFYQAFKSLYSSMRVIKPNGHFLLFAECIDGLGDNIDKFNYWFSKSRSDIILELKNNFDVVGQIAYWTKYVVENFHFYLCTNDNNIKEFNYIGLKAINIEKLNHILFDIYNDKNLFTYIIPFANITCLSLNEENDHKIR